MDVYEGRVTGDFDGIVRVAPLSGGTSRSTAAGRAASTLPWPLTGQENRRLEGTLIAGALENLMPILERRLP